MLYDISEALKRKADRPEDDLHPLDRVRRADSVAEYVDQGIDTECRKYDQDRIDKYISDPFGPCF